jgi:hypothetical protein
MNDKTEIAVQNGSNLTENNQNGAIKVSYNGAVEGSFSLNAQVLSGGNINYGPRSTYTSYHDLSGGYNFDATKLGPEQVFDVSATASAQFPNLAQNDSTSGLQVFSNYYSYDDGTAEAAYGPTGAQSRLAMRFKSYESDSLIGLKIHFVPSVNDVSGKLFLITVWEDNGGLPGDVLYEDDIFFPRSPNYSGSRNGFLNYFFLDTMKVAVGTTFYVGWRQLDPERLNVGLDRNLDHSHNTFYSVDNGVTWKQSSIKGSVMIRPIFSTSLDTQLGISTLKHESPISIYPNPSEDKVVIDIPWDQFQGATLHTPSGTTVKTISETSFSVVDLSPGMYFLKIIGTGQLVRICRQ